MEDREKLMKNDDDWIELENLIDGVYLYTTATLKINNEQTTILKAPNKGKIEYSIYTKGNPSKFWLEKEKFLLSSKARNRLRQQAIKSYGKKEGTKIFENSNGNAKYKHKSGKFPSMKALIKYLKSLDLEIIWLR